jgi:F-type H+-transporting ATPase subunit delta
VKQIILAKRYARAIFALGKEHGTVDVYAQALKAIADLFVNPDLGVADALTNPLYPLEVRLKVMAGIAESAGADSLLGAFLHLLVEKKRVSVLPEVADQVREMMEREENISHGWVTSAVKLDKALLAKIRATLEKITGNKILLETQVDPSIIGGMVARVGDLVLDGSIRTQLNGLKESIKGRE